MRGWFNQKIDSDKLKFNSILNLNNAFRVISTQNLSGFMVNKKNYQLNVGGGYPSTCTVREIVSLTDSLITFGLSS